MSYSLEDLGSTGSVLLAEGEDHLDRLAQATDILDLLRRADAFTPAEIDLWAALVMGDVPELYMHSPAPPSPTLVLAVAESMSAEAAVWRNGGRQARAVAEAAHLSCAALQLPVLNELPGAYRDHIAQRGDELVAIARAAATDARGLTLDRWREADQVLEVIAWILGSLVEGDRGEPGVIDPISGAHTRTFFEMALRNELWRVERYPAELSIVLLQLRRSASLLADQRPGPRLLACTASVMQRELRRADVIARLSSRRLGALLPATGPRDALIAASRLGEVLHDDSRLEGWSIDIGVTGLGMETLSAEELLDQARHAMLSAQRGAANCPFVYV